MDSVGSANKLSRELDLGLSFGRLHLEILDEVGQLRSSPSTTSTTVGNNSDRLLRPLVEQLVESVFELSGVATVVLGGKDNEGGTGADELAPFTNGEVGVVFGVDDLCSEFASICQGTGREGCGGGIDGDNRRVSLG